MHNVSTELKENKNVTPSVSMSICFSLIQFSKSIKIFMDNLHFNHDTHQHLNECGFSATPLETQCNDRFSKWSREYHSMSNHRLKTLHVKSFFQAHLILPTFHKAQISQRQNIERACGLCHMEVHVLRQCTG